MGEWLIEAQGAVEVWTIDGEARRNVLTRAMVAALGEQLAALKSRPGVRAVVLFSAGYAELGAAGRAAQELVHIDARDGGGDGVMGVRNRADTLTIHVVQSTRNLYLRTVGRFIGSRA